MAKWVKRCNEFVEVRELIDAEDYNGILKKLSEKAIYIPPIYFM